jgi:acyl carrier protein
MERTEILDTLRHYVAREILEGKDMGLDAATPLLEWGILNSIEIGRIVAFIQKQLGVVVPPEKILPEHFISLAALSDLVWGLSRRG